MGLLNAARSGVVVIARTGSIRLPKLHCPTLLPREPLPVLDFCSLVLGQCVIGHWVYSGGMKNTGRVEAETVIDVRCVRMRFLHSTGKRQSAIRAAPGTLGLRCASRRRTICESPWLSRHSPSSGNSVSHSPLKTDAWHILFGPHCEVRRFLQDQGRFIQSAW